MGITIDVSYKDDDGLSGSNITSMENGRNIINYVKENRNLEMFGNVRDIVDILLWIWHTRKFRADHTQ